MGYDKFGNAYNVLDAVGTGDRRRVTRPGLYTLSADEATAGTASQDIRQAAKDMFGGLNVSTRTEKANGYTLDIETGNKTFRVYVTEVN